MKNSFAQSKARVSRGVLWDAQAEAAQNDLNKIVRKTQKSIRNMEILPDEYKKIAIDSLDSSRVLFLANLESDCFVVAIGGGAVGGSALGEDIKLCKIAKTKAKTAEIRALLSSILKNQ